MKISPEILYKEFNVRLTYTIPFPSLQFSKGHALYDTQAFYNEKTCMGIFYF